MKFPFIAIQRLKKPDKVQLTITVEIPSEGEKENKQFCGFSFQVKKRGGISIGTISGNLCEYMNEEQNKNMKNLLDEVLKAAQEVVAEEDPGI